MSATRTRDMRPATKDKRQEIKRKVADKDTDTRQRVMR